MEGDFTRIYGRMRAGDEKASSELIELVYLELRRLATSHMRREREYHTLQPTAVVHEAYMKIVGTDKIEFQDRSHFFALASQQMRRILVDYGRQFRSKKRGGGAAKLEIDENVLFQGQRDADVLELDDALKRLDEIDPRAAKVVELRFFGGNTDREIAEILEISFASVRRDWEFARAWLFHQLKAQ